MITFQEFLELAESSTPERGKRRIASRGPSSDAETRSTNREKTSNRAALKKAGFKRSPSGSKYDLNVPSSSDHHFTAIFTHRNQSDYASSSMHKKQRYDGKVEPTKNRVRNAKDLRKQLGGDRTAKKVHDVSIFTKGDSPNKNDPKQLVSRGKSFKKELRAVPKSLKDKGAKPGDKVTATPVAHMPGENSKSGQQKRDKIYTKELGAKMNPRTGKTMGTMREFLEIEESSTPERGKRKLASRGPLKNKYSRGRQRSETSDKVALRKAGFRRSANNDNFPTDSQDSSSKHHETNVATYKTQSDYAKDSLPAKKSFGKKVRKTAERVRKIKALRKQMGGDRTPRQVHDVSIHSKDDETRKNDPKNLVSRGKSFKQEVRAVPKSLKNAGAKPGDKVTSTPSGIMPGENRKEGAKKRDKIYTKELGSKMNPKTGKTMGTMRKS